MVRQSRLTQRELINRSKRRGEITFELSPEFKLIAGLVLAILLVATLRNAVEEFTIDGKTEGVPLGRFEASG